MKQPLTKMDKHGSYSEAHDPFKVNCSLSKTPNFFSNGDDTICAINSLCFSNKAEIKMKVEK